MMPDQENQLPRPRHGVVAQWGPWTLCHVAERSTEAWYRIALNNNDRRQRKQDRRPGTLPVRRILVRQQHHDEMDVYHL